MYSFKMRASSRLITRSPEIAKKLVITSYGQKAYAKTDFQNVLLRFINQLPSFLYKF